MNVKLNPALHEYVAIVAKSGFFGATGEEVCERLIARGIERLSNDATPVAQLLRNAIMRRSVPEKNR